jgi:hypothetical protein
MIFCGTRGKGIAKYLHPFFHKNDVTFLDWLKTRLKEANENQLKKCLIRMFA